MRQSDALRIVNKCRRMYPDLDFTNVTLMNQDKYEYKFDAESGGLYRGRDKSIYVRIPTGGNHPSSFRMQHSFLMTTLLHEAIHRKVHFIYGIGGHGLEFQRECLKYGLDPIKETAHDERACKYVYPLDKNDYQSYRNGLGDAFDFPGHLHENEDVVWALSERHDRKYHRICHAYIRHIDAIKNMRMCREAS